jgi:hypothetical protein
VFSKHLAVGGAGELSSTIRVDDEVLRVAALAQRHTQSGNDQGSIEKLTHGPTDDTPAKDIQNRNQV